MAFSPNQKYPGATDPNPNYKDGVFRDNSPATTNNGSPLKAIDRNELLSLQEAIFNAAGFNYNGIADTPQDSQMFEAYKASLSNGANLISNHNFLIQSPDDSQPPPDATPRTYPPGFQIFSGVFANETTGILNLTYIDGRVSFSGGDFYMPVPNTGGVERLTDFVASVADFDGKPRTRGVSYALVGDEYRITVGVDALEDVTANPTPLGSVKFEQGGVATGHEAVGNASEIANAGDSQLAGGDIWPIDNTSVKVGDQLLNIQFVKDATTKTLYKMTPKIANGEVTSVNFSTGALVVGGVSHTMTAHRVGFQKTIFASDYAVADWNGSTGTNNKIAFKHMLELLKQADGWAINLDCEFLIDIDSVSDLVEIVSGTDRDYALSLIENVQVPTIYGSGKIHFRNTSGKRVWLGVFKDCDRPSVRGVSVHGGFTPIETTVITSSQHGFMFYNCEQPIQSRTKIEHIDGAPNSVTGQPISPATEINTGTGAIIENNFFNYYEQCSTFGAGTRSYWFKNNLCKNHWLSGLKISSNIAAGAGSSVGEFKVIDNIHDWDNDFKIPLIYDGVTRAFPQGLSVQANGRLVDYRGNTVDMTKIPAAQVVNPQITCISLSGDFSDDVDKWTTDIVISNNQLLGSQHNSSFNLMLIAPAAFNVTVENNPTFSGNVSINTTNPITTRRGTYKFFNNGNDGVQTPGQPIQSTTFLIDRLYANTLQIGGNFNGGDIFFTSQCDVERIAFKELINCGEVKMNAGGDKIKANKLVIRDCETERMQLYFDASVLLKSAIVNGLSCDADTGIGLELRTENIDCDVQFLSLQAFGGDIAGGLIPTAFSLDKGNLRVGDVGFNANANTAWVLGNDVTVRAGRLGKVGAPTFKAFSGVMYTQFDSPYDTWLKMSSTGNSNWEKIQTAP